MNTPVSFPIAEILFKKHGVLLSNISDVVMWLYEKYGVWITPLPITKNKWYWEILYDYVDEGGWVCRNDSNEHTSPTEAYLAAIEYVLKKLI